MKSLILFVFAVLILSEGPLGASVANMTPVSMVLIDGKMCIATNGGVQCPGEGLKCVAPCIDKATSTRDERPACRKAATC